MSYLIKIQMLEGTGKKLDECISRIKRKPELYPQIYKHLRRAIVKRFPFIIVYDYSEKEIIIYAVFHSRRNPQSIKQRLPNTV